MTQYYIEPKTKKYIKGYRFLTFARNFPYKYRKQLLDSRLDALKTVFKEVVQETAEGTGEFTENKIADKIVKAKPVIDENPKDVEEIIIPPEEREQILNELRQVL